MTRPRSPYAALSRAYAGKDALQGPHQDAQKSTSTTLPAVSRSAPPVSPAAAIGGNTLPGATCAGRAGPRGGENAGGGAPQKAERPGAAAFPWTLPPLDE